MAGGPLGKYSQIVAAIIATGVIGAAVAARFLGVGDPFLDNLALIATGAVFGASASAAVTNGTIKRDVDALHKRLDAASIPADG